METNFNSTHEFKIQVLSRGGFIDKVDGTVYTIATRTLRLNQKALDEYREKEKEFKTKVCALLELPVEGTSVVQIVSEIFGVCTIVGDGRDEIE